MGRSFVRVTGVAIVLGALALPAAAQAQTPSYGGGRLPASAPRGSFVPTVGIVLQPRGDRIAFRFDTSIKCGREFYEAVGRKVVPFDGRSFRAKGASRFRIGTGRGNRVIFAWTLRRAGRRHDRLRPAGHRRRALRQRTPDALHPQAEAAFLRPDLRRRADRLARAAPPRPRSAASATSRSPAASTAR